MLGVNIQCAAGASSVIIRRMWYVLNVSVYVSQSLIPSALIL